MNILRITLVVAVSLVAMLSYGVPARAEARDEGSIAPVSLTCEYAADPLIDVEQPRLAWINSNVKNTRGAAQTAYRIRVALTADGFDSPVWDSGRVGSAQSAFIPYEGPMESRTSYLVAGDGVGRAGACLGVERSRPLAHGPALAG